MNKRKTHWNLARWSPLVVVAFLLLIISACAGNDTDDNQGEDAAKNDAAEEATGVTYEADVKEIVANNCLTCHGEGSKAPMDDYESLMVYVNGERAGSFMRTLDNGDNTEDGEPGFMYSHLGETDEEREENLAVLKEWVGNWTVKDTDDLTEEDLEAIVATEK